MLVALISVVQIRGESLQEEIQKGADLTGRNIRIGITKSFPEVPVVTNGATQVGFGDQFQYTVVYEEYLRQQGANVVVDASKPLKTLFKEASQMKLSDGIDTKDFEEIQLRDLFDTLNSRVPNFERTTGPLLNCPDADVLKWDKIIKEKTNGFQPVVFFTLGAPHHPERFPTTAEWNEFTKNMPKAFFINAQCKGDDINNSVRPSAWVTDFDKKAFMDSLAIVVATIVLNSGFAVSPDTGTLHLAAAGVEGKDAAVNRVLGVLAKHPDQRWRLFNYMKTIATKDGVKINKCVWYRKSTLLFQQTGDNFLLVIKAMKEHINNPDAITKAAAK